MWMKLKCLLGIDAGLRDFDEIECSLHRDVVNRNFFFHLFIIIYELVMLVSISLRPGGPFLKPRRTAYFLMYLILILVTLCVMAGQAWVDRKKENSHRYYFWIEHAYLVFFSFWGIAVTLNDQLGGNGLTVYNYVILILAILSMMKPWKTALLFLADVLLFNLLLPYFPDPAGLNHTYNNLMNSLFLSLVAIGIATSLYNSRIQSKKDEITIRRQYQQIEAANKILSKEALTDALTGIQNRNSYKKAIRILTQPDTLSLACVYIDVNGLHEINNHLGHKAGDVMLKTVAAILLKNFGRESVFRIGGDEFVVLCRDVLHQTVTENLEDVRQEVERAGYSISVGLEWREEGLDINEIIQAAETDMQMRKEEYYSAQGGERQKRSLDSQMQRLITEKRDAERFLRVLAPVFKGVYFVNLETDTLRQIFIPSYFEKMLEESRDSFSKALLMYANRMVEPKYVRLFEQFCDYGNLEMMLDGDEIPGFTYQKRDGSRLKLRVLRSNSYFSSSQETLWIFSDMEESY